MKKLIRAITQDLRHAANGLAYADVGEGLPPSQKAAALRGPASQRPPARPRASGAIALGPAPRRCVALVVQQTVRPEALRYALSVCGRVDAELDILTSLPEGKLSQALERVIRQFAVTAVRWRIVRVGQDLFREIAAHVRTCPNLLFVVASAADGLADQVMQAGTVRYAGAQVPWVMVTDSPPPEMAVAN